MNALRNAAISLWLARLKLALSMGATAFCHGICLGYKRPYFSLVGELGELSFWRSGFRAATLSYLCMHALTPVM
jgi:hypothetical protein